MLIIPNTSSITWKLQPNGVDYTSENGQYIAIYYATLNGCGSYLTFMANSPSRKIRDALSVGGLPKRLPPF